MFKEILKNKRFIFQDLIELMNVKCRFFRSISMMFSGLNKKSLKLKSKSKHKNSNLCKNV